MRIWTEASYVAWVFKIAAAGDTKRRALVAQRFFSERPSPLPAAGIVALVGPWMRRLEAEAVRLRCAGERPEAWSVLGAGLLAEVEALVARELAARRSARSKAPGR